MDLLNKKILIVGGSSGIGLALTELLSASGAVLYNISRSVGPWTYPVNHLTLDVTGDLGAMGDFLPEQLHGLVYCPGSITLKPFNRLKQEDFVNDYIINVAAAAMVVQRCLPGLKNSQGASVVLMSSVAAKTGMPYHASIAAAKGAIEALTRSLAAELSSSKIRVNAVAPSLTETPLSASLLNTESKKQNAAARHPLGKYGQAIEIAKTCAFLISDDSNWITGQVIGVDGGLGTLVL